MTQQPAYFSSPALMEENLADEAFRQLMQTYLASPHRRKVEIIEKAYRLAFRVHRGTHRRDGTPYILHPIAVAQIVAGEMGLGSTSICAALLHEVCRKQDDLTTDDIKRMFGDKIGAITEGLSRISGGILGRNGQGDAERFRKLLLSMATDVRVILIKMADRLHNMRNLAGVRLDKKPRILTETLYVYAPLAERLGLHRIKTELEDLAFHDEHPEQYASIQNKIEANYERKRAILENFITPVLQKLDHEGISYQVKARVKSPYSIWNKMMKKAIPFEEVYDIYAIRIIFRPVPGQDEAHTAKHIAHTISQCYPVHPERIRNWIDTPRPNGYRALHLTAEGNEGHWVEVQIRSQAMDTAAELGLAAHWRYKTGQQRAEAVEILDNTVNRIKDILANPNPTTIDFLDSIRLSEYASEIYIFTPKGDLHILPSGATVLDAAFAIHSQLGLHCVAGKVNHRLLGINCKLQSGDTLQVITAASRHPAPDWLNKCITPRALTKIKNWLRHNPTTPETPHTDNEKK